MQGSKPSAVTEALAEAALKLRTRRADLKAIACPQGQSTSASPAAEQPQSPAAAHTSNSGPPCSPTAKPADSDDIAFLLDAEFALDEPDEVPIPCAHQPGALSATNNPAAQEMTARPGRAQAACRSRKRGSSLATGKQPVGNRGKPRRRAMQMHGLPEGTHSVLAKMSHSGEDVDEAAVQGIVDGCMDATTRSMPVRKASSGRKRVRWSQDADSKGDGNRQQKSQAADQQAGSAINADLPLASSQQKQRPGAKKQPYQQLPNPAPPPQQPLDQAQLAIPSAHAERASTSVAVQMPAQQQPLVGGARSDRAEQDRIFGLMQSLVATSNRLNR